MAAAAAHSLSTNLQTVHKPNLQTPKLQSPPTQSLKPYTLQNPSFSRISQSISTTFSRRRCLLQPIPATALPTANPERLASVDKVPQWSVRAIKAFAQAELQARKLKHPETGTDSLLLGILIEGTGAAAKYLWENGITVSRARDVVVKLLGDADVFTAVPGEFPPLTEDVQRAIDWAVDHKMKSGGGGGEVTTIDIILGIWSDADSPGHIVLAAMGFNDEKAKELESRNFGPGMVEA